MPVVTTARTPVEDVVALDLYGLLGISLDAEPRLIKAAYRECMRAAHPDVTGQVADAELMTRFTMARDVLLDNDKREVYDAARARWATRPAAGHLPFEP